MRILTTQSPEAQRQHFIDRNLRTLIDYMKSYTAQGKEASLEMMNPWDCNPEYCLTVVTIKI